MNFKIFICFVIYIGVTESETDIVSEKLEQVQKIKTQLAGKTSDEIASLVNTLKDEIKLLQKENGYNQKEIQLLRENGTAEMNLKYRLMATIDFAELIKGLFEECYPEWGEHINEKQLTDSVWRTLLLNVEHPRIISIKTDLKRFGVSENEFIKTITHFRDLRNQKSHFLLSNTERKRAYPEFLKHKTGTHRAVISAILKFAYHVTGDAVESLDDFMPENPTTTTLSTEEMDLRQKIIDETKALRRDSRLLIISNFQSTTMTLDERSFEEALKDVQVDDTKINIVSCVVLTNKVYILFEDFESALAAMKEIKSKQYDPEKKTKFLITNTTGQVLNKNNADSSLKIEIRSPDKIDNVINYLKTELGSEIQKGWSFSVNKPTSPLFYNFKTTEGILKAYHMVKKNFCSGEAVVMPSIIPRDSVKGQGATATIPIN